MKHRLEVDSVILDFGSHRVLQDVYVGCETGRITGLLGRNGTGKTCLMNIIIGDLDIIEKSVRLDGKALYGNARKHTDIRYLPQTHFIPAHLSMRRVFKDFSVSVPVFFSCFPDFEELYDLRLGKFSSGMRRIVEIYCVLASEAKFCLLDEPFSHIMPRHIESIMLIMEKEKQKKGILVTDHMYKHVLQVCDSIYLIKNARTHLVKDAEDLVTLGYIRA